MDAVEYLKNEWNSNPKNNGSDYDVIYWEPEKPRAEICPSGYYLDVDPWQRLSGFDAMFQRRICRECSFPYCRDYVIPGPTMEATGWEPGMDRDCTE